MDFASFDASGDIPHSGRNGLPNYRRVTTDALTSNLANDCGTLKLRVDMKNESKTNLAVDQIIITDKNSNMSSSGSYTVSIDFARADLQNPKKYSENFLIRYGTGNAEDTTNLLSFNSGELALNHGTSYFSPNGATYSYRLAYFDNQDKLVLKDERENAGSMGTHGFWHLVLVEPDIPPKPDPKPNPNPSPNPGPNHR